MSSLSSLEDLQTAHKKALKSLEGEKRAALKKAKALKGKKGKDALAAVETEYATKLQELERKHANEVEGLNGEKDESGEVTATATATTTATTTSTTTTTATTGQNEEATSTENDTGLSERERKLEKARRKKEKQRQKALEEERQLEEIAANAGPNMRHVEMEQLQSTYLAPLQLQIQEVAADGHCLYRAVGAQIQQDYPQVRSLCADTLQAHADEFSPFCELTDTVRDFDQYVDQVRNSAEWGGHLELRALGKALQRPITVYSMNGPPLTIQEEKEEGETPMGDINDDNNDPIRLSYHHHYYALGEHYNQVVPKQDG